MIMRVMSRWSTNEDTDNPDVGTFFDFIPANNPALCKITQFVALIAYCVFADESLKDIVTAIETFPNFQKANKEDKIFCMVASCVLRCLQGMLASLVVLLLVISTVDVVEIVLNFTAVNFISAFDDVAFELAQTGKYGPRLEAEANRIEELPVPACIYRKYKHIRYRYTVWTVFALLIAGLSVVTAFQFNKSQWITTRLRIQFKDDPLFEKFNGCYDISKQDGVTKYWSLRVLYDNYPANEVQARFGYCDLNRKWYLFTGNKTDACDLEEDEKMIYSARTYMFGTHYSPCLFLQNIYLS